MKELIEIQSELNVPKNQKNNFGKYNYRSCEDILEAIKPLLVKHDCTLIVFDKIINIGERYYIESTALLQNNEKEEAQATGYAREEENKKGMDSAQLTGSTSSYARKYALGGLFLLDDNKDPDMNEYRKQQQKASPQRAEQSASKQYRPVQEPRKQQSQIEKKTQTQLEKEETDLYRKLVNEAVTTYGGKEVSRLHSAMGIEGRAPRGSYEMLIEAWRLVKSNKAIPSPEHMSQFKDLLDMKRFGDQA